jgi:hypothetical protein
MTVCMVIADNCLGLRPGRSWPAAASLFHEFSEQREEWRVRDLDLRRMRDRQPGRKVVNSDRFAVGSGRDDSNNR